MFVSPVHYCFILLYMCVRTYTAPPSSYSYSYITITYMMHNYNGSTIIILLYIPLYAQSPLSLGCCLSPASSLMALSSTGYHQENPMEDQCMRLSMEQMTPTSLQWTLGVETPTTTSQDCNTIPPTTSEWWQ